MQPYDLVNLIETGDYDAIATLLKEAPDLKDKYVKFGLNNEHEVHPLHFACDCVFEHKIVEIIALQIIKVFIEAGSDVNGKALPMKDTPLVAAISLYCDQIALFLLEQEGIDKWHKGTHGGMALHWAAWTGSLIAAEKLIDNKTALNSIENEFGATPLHWAVNGLMHSSERNQRQQLAVIECLLKAGADPLISNNENITIYEIAAKAGLKKVSRLLQDF